MAVGLSATYISLSSALIIFNKYLMNPARFPHAACLTMIHMMVTGSLAWSLSALVPQLYPSMSKARENWQAVLKWVIPLSLLFAIALFTSNKAYMYCSVAFLQFCKQGNVALMFALSCVLGLTVFSWKKAGILAVVVAGCSMCVHGEINFLLVGFLLQICSQFCECGKNVLGELIMGGTAMKLDALTFVAFLAPCAFVPLFCASVFLYTPEVHTAFMENWHLLALNAPLAFMLNVSIALCLKYLSALAFVVVGVLKDIFLVTSSFLIFGDPVSFQQWLGFSIAIAGVSLWSHHKMQERAEAEAAQTCLINKDPEAAQKDAKA